jgi:hypothetical protein
MDGITNMKIIGLIEDLNGSKYHRVKLCLDYFEATYVDILFEEVLVGCDVLWIHYNCAVPAAQLSIWKHKYGFKLVVDYDDTWEIPLGHPAYKKLVHESKNSKDLAYLADTVTVSTEDLKNVLQDYNSEVMVLRNHLPDTGQFKFLQESKESFVNRKVRIGLIGSLSHLKGWQSIKGWINRIVDLDVEFYIVLDKQYRDQFKIKGAIYLDPLPPEMYMVLYGSVDILLCPLEDNTLSRMRSPLKLYEAACSNTYCVLDKLYKDKDDVSGLYPIVTKEKEWLEEVRDLIADKDGLYHTIQTVSQMVRSTMDFDKRLRTVENILNISVRDFQQFQIYTICYKEGQDTEFRPYMNKVSSVEEKSYLFEYNVMLALQDTWDKSGSRWCGVFSHKFPYKTAFFKKKVEWILEYEKADLVSFCPKLSKPYLQFTEEQHPGFIPLFKELCQYLGLTFKEPRVAIYGSFFVMDSMTYWNYIEHCLKPAIEYMENHPNRDKFFIDSKYSGLPKVQLKIVTGLDYYPMITFLLERLVSVWAETNKLKIKNYSYV